VRCSRHPAKGESKQALSATATPHTHGWNMEGRAVGGLVGQASSSAHQNIRTTKRLAIGGGIMRLRPPPCCMGGRRHAKHGRCPPEGDTPEWRDAPACATRKHRRGWRKYIAAMCRWRRRHSTLPHPEREAAAAAARAERHAEGVRARPTHRRCVHERGVRARPAAQIHRLRCLQAGASRVRRPLRELERRRHHLGRRGAYHHVARRWRRRHLAPAGSIFGMRRGVGAQRSRRLYGDKRGGIGADAVCRLGCAVRGAYGCE
jgi:hypothetical protein